MFVLARYTMSFHEFKAVMGYCMKNVFASHDQYYRKPNGIYNQYTLTLCTSTVEGNVLFYMYVCALCVCTCIGDILCKSAMHYIG